MAEIEQAYHLTRELPPAQSASEALGRALARDSMHDIRARVGQPDADAIADDWAAVGRDIAAGIRKFEREERIG